MKKLLLLICLIALPVFAGYNPKWIKITPSTNMIVKNSNVDVILTATFQPNTTGIYSDVTFSLAGINSPALPGSASGTSWTVNISGKDAAIYYADATIGTAIMNTYKDNRRVTVVDVIIDSFYEVGLDDYKSVQITILPEDIIDPVTVDLGIDIEPGVFIGHAEFYNDNLGGIVRTITESGVILIKGFEITDPLDGNALELYAEINTYLCADQKFAVKDKDCDAKFAGITFDVHDWTGIALKGISNLNSIAAVNVPIEKDENNQFFAQVNPKLKMGAPITYQPKITINGATDDDHAKEFRVGLVQSYLSTTTEYTYAYPAKGAVYYESTKFGPNGLKDGVKFTAQNNKHHPLFVQTGDPNKLAIFPSKDGFVKLKHDDVIGSAGYILLNRNFNFPGGYQNALLSNIIVKQKFRTWVVVEHIESGCVKSLHHVDWNTDYDIDLAYPQANPFPPTLTFNKNDMIVTDTNGNGLKPYIVSNKVAEEVLKYAYKK